MSLTALKTFDDNPISNGRFIKLVDVSGTWLAQEWDEKSDSLADIVGVTYTKLNNGRLVANVNGYCFNDFDYFEWNEDLSPTSTGNSNYVPSFNPGSDSAYIYLASCGMVAVDNTYSSVPSNYKKLRTGTSYDLYLIL